MQDALRIVPASGAASLRFLACPLPPFLRGIFLLFSPLKTRYTVSMAQKKKSRKNKNKSITLAFKVIILVSILALLALWCYNHQTEVRSSLATLTQKIESALEGEKSAETVPSESSEAVSKSASSQSGESSSSTPAQPESESAKSQPSAPQAAASAVPDGLIQLPSELAFPRCPAVKHAPDHELRHFTDYDICYRESYEQAEWSAYQLERSELVKNASRSNDFRPDPQISTESASLADYRKSGYDRGHLAPAADFAYSPEAMSETFYMSNMTPQAPQFNRGIWKDLEEDVRSWANKYGRAYVICGPVLDESADRYATIGASKVVIPRYFYKIVLLPVYEDKEDFATPDDCTKLIARAYLIPNKQCNDSYEAYRVSINEIESRTGIDFFYLLDDSIEEKIESKASD